MNIKANPALLAAYEQYRHFIALGVVIEPPEQLPISAGNVSTNGDNIIGRDQNIQGDYLRGDKVIIQQPCHLAFRCNDRPVHPTL